MLARSHQRLIWERNRSVLRLRSLLREYFPAALAELQRQRSSGESGTDLAHDDHSAG